MSGRTRNCSDVDSGTRSCHRSSVTCYSSRIFCWKQQHVLLGCLVSGPAGVHNTFSCTDDTVNLFTYAVMRLTPHALSSSTNSWSYLRKGTVSSVVTTASHSSTSMAALGEHRHMYNDSLPGMEGQKFNIPRALQREKWSKGKDGFIVTDSWGTEMGSATPAVWLRQAQERMYLCIYQHKSMTVILLIPVNSMSNGERDLAIVKQRVLETAAQQILRVEERLSKGWGGENAYHVRGYRYLLLDTDQNISRASPTGKVATLTKESLLALSKLREEIDLEKNRAKRDDPQHEKDVEVCIRAKNNAWVIGRITRGKELYMVLEKANETLLYASDAVEKFSSRYCNGAFSLD
uniref:Vacuolar fusion protein CCZ1 n=1 Tax=Anthurium amnicola TaxID=1678845 RepID=A0A1D1ZIZ5_9ARAE